MQHVYEVYGNEINKAFVKRIIANEATELRSEIDSAAEL